MNKRGFPNVPRIFQVRIPMGRIPTTRPETGKWWQVGCLNETTEERKEFAIDQTLNPLFF
jgi:hypothetical protein